MAPLPDATSRLLESALRVGGPDGPDRLRQKLDERDPPLDLDALAAFVATRVPSSDNGMVMDSVMRVLLNPKIPMLSIEAVGGMIGIAVAEAVVNQRTAGIVEALQQELAAGRPLTKTKVWKDFVAAPSFDARYVLSQASAQLGADDLLECAVDPQGGRSQEVAIEFLARRVTDRRLQPLSASELKKLGQILTMTMSKLESWELQNPPLIPAWVQCDPKGAEGELVRRFESTGKIERGLLYQLAEVRRSKAQKAEWGVVLGRLVEAQVTRGEFVCGLLGQRWLRVAPAEGESYLAQLDFSTISEQARRSIAQFLDKRSTPGSQAVLRRLAASDDRAGQTALRSLRRGDEESRRRQEVRDARDWLATGSADSLKRIYNEHLESLLFDAPKFDIWMTRLGAKGIREAFTFRAKDRPGTSLFVDVDKRGRLRGIKFDE